MSPSVKVGYINQLTEVTVASMLDTLSDEDAIALPRATLMVDAPVTRPRIRFDTPGVGASTLMTAESDEVKEVPEVTTTAVDIASVR